MIGTLDRRLFGAVQDLAAHTAWAYRPVLLYATFGVVLFGPLLVAGWWRARSRPRPARAVAAVLWAVLAAGLVLALNQGLVHLVDRPRPFVALPGVRPLLGHARSPGFPSDHAVAVGAMAAGLWRCSVRLGRVAAVLAVLMCAARVYCGVHWPTDVAAGVALGAAVGWFGWYPAGHLLEPVCARVARGPAGVLVRRRPVGTPVPAPVAVQPLRPAVRRRAGGPGPPAPAGRSSDGPQMVLGWSGQAAAGR